MFNTCNPMSSFGISCLQMSFDLHLQYRINIVVMSLCHEDSMYSSNQKSLIIRGKLENILHVIWFIFTLNPCFQWNHMLTFVDCWTVLLVSLVFFNNLFLMFLKTEFGHSWKPYNNHLLLIHPLSLLSDGKLFFWQSYQIHFSLYFFLYWIGKRSSRYEIFPP